MELNPVNRIEKLFVNASVLTPLILSWTDSGAATPWDQGAKTMSKFLKMIRDSEGATAIEYGLIAALIAVAAIGAMTSIGNKLNTTFNNVANNLN